MQINTEAAPEFLTAPQVQQRYQRSHVTLWRWLHDPDSAFPQPIRINRLRLWRLTDLLHWETEVASRETRAAK